MTCGAAELKEELKGRMTSAGAQDSHLTKAELESAVATLAESTTKLDATITEMETKADKIGGWTSDLDAQNGEIARLSKVLDQIGVEKERLNVELKAPPRVSIWQEAALQKRDMKKQIIAASAAPIGVILLVCMAVAWLDVRQRRVRSAGEVCSGLGIRLFGAVPGVPHLERRLVGPNGEPELEGHPVLDSFDAIRTQLLQRRRRGGCSRHSCHQRRLGRRQDDAGRSSGEQPGAGRPQNAAHRRRPTAAERPSAF